MWGLVGLHATWMTEIRGFPPPRHRGRTTSPWSTATSNNLRVKCLSPGGQLRRYRIINHVVVTHPDQDHSEGLAPILEHFDVGRLWMLRPWIYAQELLPHFPRIGSAENLQKRLRNDYPYIATLEEIALRRGIAIDTPFQGRPIGAFTVLAPSPLRYGQLILSSDRTPQIKTATAGILWGVLNAIKLLVSFI